MPISNNRYLSYLLPIILGILLLVLNAFSFIHVYGALILAVMLIIIPTTLFILSGRDISGIGSLILILIPLIIYNYIYLLTQQTVVGLQDPHNHLLHAANLLTNTYHINFAGFERLSFWYVGLYIWVNILSEITAVQLPLIANFAPQILNILIIVSAFIITKNLHDVRIASFTALLYGWDITVLQFGQELRTQTMGTLFLFLYTGAILIFTRLDLRKSLSFTVTSIISFVGITLSSFVAFTNALFVFIGYMATNAITSVKGGWKQQNYTLTLTMFWVFLLTFFIYTFFISISFGESFIRTIMDLVNDMLTANADRSLFTIQDSVVLYGANIQLISQLILFILVIASIIYLVEILRTLDTGRAMVFVGFGILGGNMFLYSYLGELSIGRIYILFIFVLFLSLSYVIVRFVDKSKAGILSVGTKIVVIGLISIIVLASVGKFPHYVIGDTNPLRGVEPIDGVPWWRRDSGQDSTADFLSLKSTDQRVIPVMAIVRYPLLTVTIKRNQIQGDPMLGTLMVVHDKFNGVNYTYRDDIPNLDFYQGENKIYSNADYVVFLSDSDDLR